jgi:uncharacterized protein YjbI with pentapeptide repeats
MTNKDHIDLFSEHSEMLKERVDMLKRGVTFWNNWRNDNKVKINLSGADLNGLDLSGFNLSNAMLWSIKGNANFKGANLEGSLLNWANLSYSNLQKANLSRSSLDNAVLRNTHFEAANLSYATLNKAELSQANLSNANLSYAHLNSADLYFAQCYKANFSEADLKMTRLMYARMDGTNLTGANIWQTQRAGWSIKGVECEFIYLEREGTKTVFEPGEFERLYADKTKIVLSFQGGITPLEIATLPALIKHLENSYSGCSLSLESIKDDVGGASVTLVVNNERDFNLDEIRQIKAQLEEKGKEAIEHQKLALKEKETRLMFEGEVKQLNSFVDKLIMKPSQIIQVDVIRGDKILRDKIETKIGSISNVSGQLFIGKFNDVIANLNNTGQNELADALKSLKEAIMASQSIPDEQKKEQIEVINQVGEEAAKPSPNKTLLKMLGSGLLTTLKTIPDLVKVVGAVAPFIEKLYP